MIHIEVSPGYNISIEIAEGGKTIIKIKEPKAENTPKEPAIKDEVSEPAPEEVVAGAPPRSPKGEGPAPLSKEDYQRVFDKVERELKLKELERKADIPEDFQAKSPYLSRLKEWQFIQDYPSTVNHRLAEKYGITTHHVGYLAGQYDLKKTPDFLALHSKETAAAAHQEKRAQLDQLTTEQAEVPEDFKAISTQISKAEEYWMSQLYGTTRSTELAAQFGVKESHVRYLAWKHEWKKKKSEVASAPPRSPKGEARTMIGKTKKKPTKSILPAGPAPKGEDVAGPVQEGKTSFEVPLEFEAYGTVLSREDQYHFCKEYPTVSNPDLQQKYGLTYNQVIQLSKVHGLHKTKKFKSAQIKEYIRQQKELKEKEPAVATKEEAKGAEDPVLEAPVKEAAGAPVGGETEKALAITEDMEELIGYLALKEEEKEQETFNAYLERVLPGGKLAAFKKEFPDTANDTLSRKYELDVKEILHIAGKLQLKKSKSFLDQQHRKHKKETIRQLASLPEVSKEPFPMPSEENGMPYKEYMKAGKQYIYIYGLKLEIECGPGKTPQQVFQTISNRNPEAKRLQL